MRRDDSVICACCGREFTARLTWLVRQRPPIWCVWCVDKADRELEKAQERARRYLGDEAERE